MKKKTFLSGLNIKLQQKHRPKSEPIFKIGYPL